MRITGIMAVAAILSVCATAPSLAQGSAGNARAQAYAAYGMVTDGGQVIGQDPDQFIRLQMLRQGDIGAESGAGGNGE